jgi:hypothetical protein
VLLEKTIEGNVMETNRTESPVRVQPTGSRTRLAFKLWDRGLATFTALSVIIGGGVGLLTYLGERGKEQGLRRQEIELLRYKERKEIYHPLCKLAGEIVASKSLKEAEPSIKSFWALYYGEVGIVAEGLVQKAMEEFGSALRDFTDSPNAQSSPEDQRPPPELTRWAKKLADQCRESLDLNKVFGPTEKDN